MEQVGQSGQSEWGSIDRTRALYERPALGVEDAITFHEVRGAVEAHFATTAVEAFLRSLRKSDLRIRDFAAVLATGKLGSATAAQYAKLSPSDQGQIREFYLAALEQVSLPLRDKFFKLYAYY